MKSRFAENDYTKIKSIFRLLNWEDPLDEAEATATQDIDAELSSQLRLYRQICRNFSQENEHIKHNLENIVDVFLKMTLQNNTPAVLQLIEIALFGQYQLQLPNGLSQH